MLSDHRLTLTLVRVMEARMVVDRCDVASLVDVVQECHMAEAEVAVVHLVSVVVVKTHSIIDLIHLPTFFFSAASSCSCFVSVYITIL